jgi:hypothetical protein
MSKKYIALLIYIILTCYISVVLLGNSVNAKSCSSSELVQYIQKFEDVDKAIKAASQCDAKSASPILLETLQSGSENAQIIAASVLGIITEGNALAVSDLEKALNNPKNSSAVLQAVSSALGRIGKPAKSAIPSLIQLLDHPDPETRNTSAFALGNIGLEPKVVVPRLIDKLDDPDMDVKASAAFSLTKFGVDGKEAIQPLLKILKDNDESIRQVAAESLGSLAEAVLDEAKREDTLPALSNALSTVTEIEKSLTNSEFETVKQPVLRTQSFLKQAILIKGVTDWTSNGISVLLTHVLFWSLLIFAYPKSPQIQAIFFWNPWVRNIFGLGYVTFLLQWTPYLRRKLFAPFRYPLLADAGLDSFNPDLYFPDSKVSLKGTEQTQSLTTLFSRIQGQIILEGESGLGKTMFLRHLLKDSKRLVVYLPAIKCAEGVIEAIQKKLHGDEIKDPKFLQGLIYSGAIDICIDGLNEVSADTRAKITQFVESHFRGNILITTQPLEWMPPATAKTYCLYPLDPDQIEHYLISRKTLLPKHIPMQGKIYEDQCRTFLRQMLSSSLVPEERKAAQTILSNPMELTLAAWAISSGKTPDLFHLREQQYEMMATEYQQLWNREFPLKTFSEAVYQLWLADKRALPTAEFFNELRCMEDEKFRMVISRQWKDVEEKAKQEWYFRHDKIAEFFLAWTFLGDGDTAKKRLYDHMGDSRFRGVYFLLATLLPEANAKQLREDLIRYAAQTKDHNVSDDFVLLFDSRRSA